MTPLDGGLAGALARLPVWALPAPSVDGDEVDRTVTDVLTRPEFANARPGWFQQLRERIRTWFLERLADLFGSEAGTAIAWGLVALAALVAILVLARVVMVMRRGGDTEQGPAVTVTRPRRPAEWLADARAARDRGERAEAVRCAYRAVVALLAERGAVEEVPGRTVGEYRRQVASRAPQHTAPFAEASDVFERIWYARRPAADDDVQRVLTIADALDGRTVRT